MFCLPCFNSSESGETAVPQEGRCVRPFTISPASITLNADSFLYRDQILTQTTQNTPINQEKVVPGEIKLYVQKNHSGNFVDTSMVDENNSRITKVTQNFYLVPFGGVRASIFKRYKVNLVLNVTIDMPTVIMPDVVSLRVPVTDKEPNTLALYIENVADRIQENYQRNGSTLIYDHHGALNSIAVAIGYLLKYTDLWLSEAVQHLRYQRSIFDKANGNLGTFTEVINQYAQKMGKKDARLDVPTGCELAVFEFPSQPEGDQKSTKLKNMKSNKENSKTTKSSSKEIKKPQNSIKIKKKTKEIIKKDDRLDKSISKSTPAKTKK